VLDISLPDYDGRTHLCDERNSLPQVSSFADDF
jgi:hypothetical protein